MSVTLKTKGEERFQGNRHGFLDRSDEPGGKTGGKLLLTMGGRFTDTSRKVVVFPILLCARICYSACIFAWQPGLVDCLSSPG